MTQRKKMKNFFLPSHNAFRRWPWGSFGIAAVAKRVSSFFGSVGQDRFFQEKGTKPPSYPLGFGLKMNATMTPRKMAAVIPPAVEVTPPVMAPSRPFSATASFTPRASE